MSQSSVLTEPTPAQVVGKHTGTGSAPRVSSYRADIDGLRAVAVLLVIIFHFSPDTLPGGFVGVDVFFVISGFLITSHILNDLERGTFSLAGFFGRRIKRIAPAMFAVVGTTTVLANLFMLPEDAAEASKSAFASILSLANVFFWRNVDTGYFGAQGRDLPLLHLWSLGIEEQFYIVWPVLLMLFYTAQRATKFWWAVFLATVASFAFAEWLLPRDPSFTYYMLPTRAGELTIGALGAAAVRRGWLGQVPRQWLGVAGLAGLALVVGSGLLISEGSAFPGMLALPPTVGTVLVILSRRNELNLTGRLLSVRPLVALGLISYSAYLWHWPLVTFFRYWYGDPGLLQSVYLFLSTLALAWLTYRFVEQPTRGSTASFRALLVGMYARPAVVIGGFALAMVYGVWPALSDTPYRRQLTALSEEIRTAHEFAYVCQKQDVSNADVTSDRCVIGAEGDGDTSILLWGDSNASHYIGILGTFANTAGFRFRNIEIGGCPPVLSRPERFAWGPMATECYASSLNVAPAVARASVLIMGGAWTDYIDRSEAFLPELFATVDSLTGLGKQVILLGKLPVHPGFDRRCRAKALRFPLVHCLPEVASIDGDVDDVNRRLREFAASRDAVSYFDINELLCSRGACSTHADDGRPLYYDRSHLSMAGSWLLGERIVDEHGVPPLFADMGAGMVRQSP